ncbi:MAG: universal stress protein [Bryobacteraceae bacterium]|nr:universal stress protein [Bryobacteraceae bacterium]
MEPFQRVTVGLARAEGDLGLLEYALRLAELRPGALFQFVHVLDWAGSGRGPAKVVDNGRARAEIVETVTRYFPGAASYCSVIHGTRLDRLLEFAVTEQSDLLLVGHCRRRSGRRSLARRLAMQAPCSLLMVPEGSAASLRGVLCAIDFSEHSALALSTATFVAGRAGLSECLALHVFFSELTAGLEEFEVLARGQERDHFERFTAPLDLHGVHVRPVFEQGPSVAHAATRLAQDEGVDLIVAGTRGQSRSASILLGSESEHLLMETPIPLLIVKQRGERMSLLEALFDRDLSTPPAPRFG